ncbi:hypothetical protein [Microcoleus sp. herbarium2]|uniref:hypothetical protein n=1 Tax=Microcoleus sp. herbarium2 TaxID=3055433 RepID=UPI002FD5EA74
MIPRISIYFSGVKVRKTQPIEGFDVACKWKRKYRGVSVKEGWFILLIVLILLIALVAYSSAIVQGTTLKIKNVKKYIVRDNGQKKNYSRRSTFGSSLDSQQWLKYLDKYAGEVQELMTLTPTKRQFYQRGMRAINPIQCSS